MIQIHHQNIFLAAPYVRNIFYTPSICVLRSMILYAAIHCMYAKMCAPEYSGVLLCIIVYMDIYNIFKCNTNVLPVVTVVWVVD
jgi:hypothetical protein